MNNPKKAVDKPAVSFIELIVIVIAITFLNVFFITVINSMNDSLVQEKFQSQKDELNLMADRIEWRLDQEPHWSSELYRNDMIFIITGLGNVGPNGSFSALFTKDLEYITPDEQSGFEGREFCPLVFDEFVDTVNREDSGEMVLWCEHNGTSRHDMHIYFRWIPSDTESERFLAVTGCSKYSLSTQFPVWITYGINLVLIFTLANNLFCFIRLRLYRREPEGGVKNEESKLSK